MKPDTQHVTLAGPAGALACAVDAPMGPRRGLALLCHPHPQFGGTMDNKVVQTMARAAVQLGWCAVRFNFRGVGGSQGAWDEGRGEVDDALAIVAALRTGDEPLLLGGFSFGGYVAAAALSRLAPHHAAERLWLVAPATSRFPVPTVPAHALVVHGDTDDVVPLADTLAWARPQQLPVVVMPGVGHFFHGQLAGLKQLLLRYGQVAPASDAGAMG